MSGAQTLMKQARIFLKWSFQVQCMQRSTAARGSGRLSDSAGSLGRSLGRQSGPVTVRQRGRAARARPATPPRAPDIREYPKSGSYMHVHGLGRLRAG